MAARRSSQICLGLANTIHQQLRRCSNVREMKLNKRRQFNVRKSRRVITKLSSILPTSSDNCGLPAIDTINKQLDNLDSLLNTLNVKIAEQQEQLTVEEEEMQKQFGVGLPSRYLSMIGSVDASVPPSKYSCVGCGAPIHCCSPHQPGFISSFKFKAFSGLQMQNCKCLRCNALEHHDVLLDAKVSADQYMDLLSNVQQQSGIILHVIDVTDFQNSTIPDLLSIVGHSQSIYVVANKADLLPKDSRNYLQHIEGCVREYASEYYGRSLRHVSVVSALTGFGIEKLITKLLKHISIRSSHIHLMGCTNAGKSTLFNSLLKSDLCKVAGRDTIARATTSVWPGTTLNLLKFPVNRLSRYMMAMRIKRLIQGDEDVREEDEEEAMEQDIKNTTLRGLVVPTIEPLEDEELENIPVNTSYDVRDVKSHYTLSTEGNSVREGKPNVANEAAFDYEQYTKSRWLYDTPGLVNNQQLINNLNMTDLKRLLMTGALQPRTYSLRSGMTMFIGGIGRIDVLKTFQPEKPILLTVVAARNLPVSVIYTEIAETFYHQSLQEDKLIIPNLTSNMENFPSLVGQVMTVQGIGYYESETDIQLSSIGWVAVTCGEGHSVAVKAYTPGGVGCHTRRSLLPFAVRLKGRRIAGSRAFRIQKSFG